MNELHKIPVSAWLVSAFISFRNNRFWVWDMGACTCANNLKYKKREENIRELNDEIK